MGNMKCPKCRSTNIDIQVMQENTQSKTITKTKSKYKERGHGCLWWLIIGWWWWVIDLMLWVSLFFPRLVIQLFKKRKYKGKSKSVSTTKNNYTYKSFCFCKDCGYSWEE